MALLGYETGQVSYQNKDPLESAVNKLFGHIQKLIMTLNIVLLCTRANKSNVLRNSPWEKTKLFSFRSSEL